jgi:hypothetical protein
MHIGAVGSVVNAGSNLLIWLLVVFFIAEMDSGPNGTSLSGDDPPECTPSS